MVHRSPGWPSTTTILDLNAHNYPPILLFVDDDAKSVGKCKYSRECEKAKLPMNYYTFLFEFLCECRSNNYILFYREPTALHAYNSSLLFFLSLLASSRQATHSLSQARKTKSKRIKKYCALLTKRNWDTSKQRSTCASSCMANAKELSVNFKWAESRAWTNAFASNNKIGFNGRSCLFAAMSEWDEMKQRKKKKKGTHTRSKKKREQQQWNETLALL